MRIYPYPSSAHRHRIRLIPTIGSIGPPRLLFFLVQYVPMSELIMIRGSLSLPPQMGNGGSPPTHLPSSTALDLCFPSVADFPVAAKWRQPPARAPEEFTATFADMDRALDRILSDFSASRRAETDRAALAKERRRDDAEQALRCRHETERALVRERTLAEEATARTRQEEAARARQEATARARQEATARTRQEKAAARANEAARTIFLWLRRRRLHARLLASLAVAVPADTRLCPQTAEARSPDLVPAEIRRIQAARDTLAAPLDALLAEFAALAVGTASPATASPVPTPSPRPRSYLDAVVGPNGRGYTSSAPPSPSVTTSHPSASAPPTPTVCTTHRAKPRHRTGRRNIPRAPSSYAAVAPTHPALLQGGLPTPTFITLARATSLCRSVVSSPTPASTTPHPPSLHPFILF